MLNVTVEVQEGAMPSWDFITAFSQGGVRAKQSMLAQA